MEISDEVRALAQKLLDEVLPSARYWSADDYVKKGHRACLWQAAAIASGNAGYDLSACCTRPQLQPDPQLATALHHVILEQYGDKAYYCNHPGIQCPNNCHDSQVITSFNDDDDVKYADVRRVIEKVIAG